MKKQAKSTVKNKAIRIIVILVLLICAQYIFTGMYRGNAVYANNNENSENNESQNDLNEGEYIRLTDLDWRSESRAGWGQLRKNMDTNGNKLSVMRQGAYYDFDYGIWAHATSNVYYDISEYSEKYHYLTMYVGLNKTSTSGNGVKVWVYTSNDDVFHSSGPQYWTIQSDADKVYMPKQDAVFMKIDISGAKYLRLQAYDNGSNANDHIVYIDPMLITDNYQEKQPTYPGVEVYDQKIKDYANKDLADPNYELLVLQRKFMSNLGEYALQRFIEEDPANEETINWLMNDLENLRYYLLGGTPSGGYYNSLKELTRLLKEYKSDFDIQEEISDAGKDILVKQNSSMPTTKGNLYKRMAITLSLTHSTRVGLWMQNSATNQSDSVTRYALYKQLYDKGQFKATDNVDITPWFETYNIEEMRWVLSTAIDDEEVIWLNEYTQSKIDAAPNSVWSLLTPHPYMAYVWPNYSNPIYYAEENDAYFNDLFGVEQRDEDGNIITDEDGNAVKKLLWDDGTGTPNYGISRGNLVYKLWMNFRNKFGTGAVCGGISKTGHCIRGANGIASTVIGQPGHAALLYYTKNSNGQGYWGIDNDVSGWAYSEKGERMMLGWGNDRTYVKGYNVPYMILAQEALNDYNNLVKAEELLMTVDLYEDDKAKQEQIYREAIAVQPINLDAWAGLTKLYMGDDTKTEEDYYNLVKEMMEALKGYPFPMYNLSNYIATKFTSDEYSFKFTLLQTKVLEDAKNNPSAEVLQPSVTKLLANHLLGQMDTNLANFSFDGADGGKIILGSRFDGSIVRWDYSLDGKNTWKEVDLPAQSDDHKQQLTQEEIESITAENDIYVHIVGANYSDENIYKIDITESAGLPSTIFANDLENRMIAANLSTQWRYSENDAWTSYSKASPDLTGNKTVQLRQGATGTSLASKEPVTFQFTEDNQPDTRKYIPVSHLTIHSVSTQATNQGGAATNAIDANFNTRYHSAWNGTDTERFIVIKLDKPVYLSAVEFVPAGGGNGRIVKGTVYGSMTGEDDDWEVLANNENAPFSYPTQANTNEQAALYTKSFEIEEPQEVQYVKIKADQTNGNWFTARAFNLYQDLTANPHPTAGIGYSTTENTNEPVIARLINPSTEITITNNEGKDTYVFTENGEFTFEFVDKDGNEGSATAKVTWIDKDIPDADVTYKLGDDKKLIAILDNISEDVYLLDQNNNKTNFIEVKDGKIESISYLDEEGNIYKVAELDENKVIKQISYKNTTGEVENVAYYVTVLQDGEIVDRLGFDNEGNSVTLTEEDITSLRKLEEVRSNPLEHYLEENAEYEFKLLDKASNITYKSVKVDYIENDTKILASDITYSNTNLTNQDVVATINPYVIDMEGRNCDVRMIEEDENGEEKEGSKTHTFTENGAFTFKYAQVKENEEDVDKEEQTHTARVSWIDKKIPTAEIRYSTTEETEGAVVATLVNESEEIVITNNGAGREHTFTENGEFTFVFIDKAGNEGTATAKVSWIIKDNDEDPILNSDKYRIEDKFISMIRPGVDYENETTIKEFKENITTNQKLEFLDENGIALEDNDIVVTGMTLKVGENSEYTLVVRGDVDGDGNITINDIAKLKLHCIEKELLTSEELKAADIDDDDEVSINDIAVEKLLLIGLKILD